MDTELQGHCHRILARRLWHFGCASIGSHPTLSMTAEKRRFDVRASDSSALHPPCEVPDGERTLPIRLGEGILPHRISGSITPCYGWSRPLLRAVPSAPLDWRDACGCGLERVGGHLRRSGQATLWGYVRCGNMVLQPVSIFCYSRERALRGFSRRYSVHARALCDRPVLGKGSR